MKKKGIKNSCTIVGVENLNDGVDFLLDSTLISLPVVMGANNSGRPCISGRLFIFCLCLFVLTDQGDQTTELRWAADAGLAPSPHWELGVRAAQ